MIKSIDNAIDVGWPAQIELLQELIRIPSITGSERRVQERVALAMSDCGLTVDSWCPTTADVESHPAYCDDGNPLGERPVVVGAWKGVGRGKSLILNGHMDVVPVGDESLWDHNPWEAVIDNECVHGRGSCDMKAGVVAALCAANALRRTGFEPQGDLFIQSVIGEETGGVGTLAAILRGYLADGAVIMEPTGLALAPAGSGALSFRLKVTGKAAHGGLREEGYSALDAFLSLPPSLTALEVRRHKRFRHDLFTDDQLAAPLSIGIVKCGDWVSTVPEELIAEGRYGIFPGEDPDSARTEFLEAVNRAADKDPWLCEHRPEVSWFEGQFEAGETSRQDPIVNSLAKAHSNAVGHPPEITGVPYGSDLRLFTNHANVSSVLYGAGDVRLAHTVKEYVPLGEVKTLTRVLARLILDWCN